MRNVAADMGGGVRNVVSGMASQVLSVAGQMLSMSGNMLRHVRCFMAEGRLSQGMVARGDRVGRSHDDIMASRKLAEQTAKLGHRRPVDMACRMLDGSKVRLHGGHDLAADTYQFVRNKMLRERNLAAKLRHAVTGHHRTPCRCSAPDGM